MELPKIVQEIRAKFPNGIFTQAAFRKKLKVGKTFYLVGLIVGDGPTRPQKCVLKKITQRRYRTDKKKHSSDFDDYIESAVNMTKGVFLSQKEADSYYCRLKNASRKDPEYLEFLLDQRRLNLETRSVFDAHYNDPLESAISGRLRSAGL